MNVWLIYPYGPIPGEGWRDYRATMIARELAARGHQVCWWTANFSHHHKVFRSRGWEDREVHPGFRIGLVPTVGYRKNIGVRRLLFQRAYAKRLLARASRENPPDLIIAGEPPRSAGRVAIRLGRRFSVPVVLDVLDLWPELFSLALPSPIRPLSGLLFSPLYRQRRLNFRAADGVVAVCDSYLETALRSAPHLRKGRSMTVHLGVDVEALRGDVAPPPGEACFWGRKAPGEIWAVYAGSLGENYDIMTLLRAAAKVQQRHPSLVFLIAGTGPLEKDVVRFIKQHNMSNARYIGAVTPERLSQLYRVCDIGLCTYSRESTVAMPVKLYDYLAAGLPIVSSIRGELEDILREGRIGLQYVSGDPESLSSALQMLAEDAEMRARMACNARHAAAEFDRAVQYGRLAQFVERVRSGGESGETAH